MSTAAAAAFILMLITHAGDTLSLTQIKEFPSQDACNTAATAIQSAVGDVSGVEFGCISVASLNTFKAANTANR